MNYRAYKGAIFDCDGTLLESMGMWKNNAARLVKHFGFEPTPDLDEKCFNVSMNEVCKYINEQYNMENNPKDLTKLAYELAYDEYLYNLELKTHTKKLLDELKSLNYRMIVATATPSKIVKECFKRLGILDYFIDIISVRDYDINKYESKIYDIALEKLDLDKSEVLVFEDALYAIKTCLKSNYQVVVVKDLYQDNLEAVLNDVVGIIEL